MQSRPAVDESRNGFMVLRNIPFLLIQNKWLYSFSSAKAVLVPSQVVKRGGGTVELAGTEVINFWIKVQQLSVFSRDERKMYNTFQIILILRLCMTSQSWLIIYTYIYY